MFAGAPSELARSGGGNTASRRYGATSHTMKRAVGAHDLLGSRLAVICCLTQIAQADGFDEKHDQKCCAIEGARQTHAHDGSRNVAIQQRIEDGGEEEGGEERKDWD